MTKFYHKSFVLLLVCLTCLALLCACGSKNDDGPSAVTIPDEPKASVPTATLNDLDPAAEAHFDANSLFTGVDLIMTDDYNLQYSFINVTVLDSLYSGLSTEMQAMVSSYLEHVAADFVLGYEEDDAAQRQADPDYEADHQLTLSLFYLGEDLISIKGELYDGSVYSANPATLFRGYNINPKGEAVGLADIVGKDYRASIGRKIYTQITGKGEQDNYYLDLETALQEKMSQYKWCANDKEIHIFYDPYEVAPYTMGTLDFTVTRD